MKLSALFFFTLITILCISFIDKIFVRLLFSFIIFGWFLFLNEFAQKKMFQSEWINGILGHLASMICLLPFYQWKTMQENKANELGLKRKWLPPLNVLIYSMKNFWNIKRLWNLYPDKLLRKKFILSILAMNTMLLGIIPRVPGFWSKFGPAYFLFLVIAEIYLQNINLRTRLSLNLKQE
jgi:hypothetical protein